MKDEIFTYVKKGETKMAVELLMKYIESDYNKYLSEGLILCDRLEYLEKSTMKGTISNEESLRIRATINDSIIKLASSLEAPLPRPKVKKGRLSKPVLISLIGLGGLIFFLLIYFILFPPYKDKIARPEKITIEGFYMDDTEISNNEYRKFDAWVGDSLNRNNLDNEDSIYLVDEVDWKYVAEGKSAAENYKAGLVNKSLEYFELAIVDFTKAIVDSANFYKAYSERGLAKRKLRNYEGAIQDYTQALRIYPQHINSLVNRSVTYQLVENYNGVITDASKALELDPNHVYALNSRANAYLEIGQFSKAQKDYHKALELQPENPVAFYGLGTLYLEQGDSALACENWKNAKFLGSNKAKQTWDTFCN